MTDQGETGCLRQAAVVERRDVRYYRTPERRIQTVDRARDFVQDLGFCFLWPIKDIEMPSLFHAIAGRVRPVPMKHNDPDLSKCWGWKDRALGAGWWYYGKLLRRRATLISFELLPHFYACSENYGGLDDYLEEYRAGTMSAEAKAVYEALLDHGPLDTVRLRREARMVAENAKSRFERALVDLQVGLKVLPVGVAEAGAWRYAFVYDIVQRHYPDLPGQAHQIPRGEARRTLVSRYLHNVVAADRKMIARVFHVLRWTAAELDATLRFLLETAAVQAVQVGNDQGEQFVPRDLARSLSDHSALGCQ